MWQMDFLDINKLASFAKDRGVKLASSNHLKSLWQVGILKADFVLSTNKIEMEGLSLLGKYQSGQYWYSDDREIKFPKGLSDVLKDLVELPHGVKPYFHPFRYLILLYLGGLLRPSISSIQELVYSPASAQMLEKWRKWFTEHTSNQEFLDDLRHHEEVVKLCIATEPPTYRLLFSRIKRPVWIDEETQQEQLTDYINKLLLHYKGLTVEQIEEVRRRLCLTAEKLDPNKDVHSILRLSRGEMRIKKVKGKLGGAMYLLTMAEMLRRFTEYAYGCVLPEEDELGFGHYPPELKKRDYDSNRLFDGNRRSGNLFLRQWGLDYGVRLRWYIEGETEFGALEWMFSDNHSVEMINLRGQVIQGRGKGLTFRDNLLNDKRSQIFSFVLFDSDVSNNLRVVRKAAENDEICGGFGISSPDFEKMNFTLTELKNIVWMIAVENGAEPDEREIFDYTVQGATSTKEIFVAATSTFPSLAHEGKGYKWGARLMCFAWENQGMVTIKGETITRPIIEWVLAALRAKDADYLHTQQGYKVDTITGKLIQRDINK
jgi:hypothetical protein